MDFFYYYKIKTNYYYYYFKKKKQNLDDFRTTLGVALPPPWRATPMGGRPPSTAVWRWPSHPCNRSGVARSSLTSYFGGGSNLTAMAEPPLDTWD